MAGPLLLVFGESPNDTKALRHLIPALLPTDKPVDCLPIRKPGTLARKTAAKKRAQLAKAIAITARHESKRRKVVVVVHEDSDDVEDAHIPHATQITAELLNAGVERPVPAVAAWEIETWWMLFPEALAACRSCWAKVDFSNRAVGKLQNSKEYLTKALRPAGSGSKCPDYAESDSERIAQEVAARRLCDDGRVNRSNSLAAFQNALVLALE